MGQVSQHSENDSPRRFARDQWSRSVRAAHQVCNQTGILSGSPVGVDRWPLAARFINEKLRLQQIGRSDKTPKVPCSGFDQKTILEGT